MMAEVASPLAPLVHRRSASLQKRRRDDLWLGSTALLASMLVLPYAPGSWHGPEMAASLAVGATALLAGQRWAIAIIVIAELLLVPTQWPRAFLGDASLAERLPSLISLLAIVPGALAVRRAAAALVLVTGQRRTRAMCRRFQAGLVLVGIVAALLPLF